MRRFAAIILATALLAPLVAQARPPVPPHDLEGLWTASSLTGLERLPAFKTLVVSDAEAKAFEAAHTRRPTLPFDNVGQDDTEWWELQGGLGRVDGQARSSWIVEPADGRLPLSPEGLAKVARHQAGLLRDFDGPEARPSPERCLTATAGAIAPPMLNTSYNSHLHIVQTPDHVVLTAEMNHDARILPIGPPPPQAAAMGPSWYGRSVARWEGNALVVETTGFRPETSWRFPTRLYVSPGARVTERFTRVSADEIRYAFTVDDPAIYTAPWRGEIPLRRAKGPMFEFACHEGNYAMRGALAGARREEGAR